MNGEQFAKALLDEVMAEHAAKERMIPKGLDEGDELPLPILKHWLNFAVYYERSSAAFIGGWLKTTPEPDALVLFAHQVEDEANHYSWLLEHQLEVSPEAASFTPPKEWRELMEEYYPGLDHIVDRLSAHNIASETAALGFLEYNVNRFPARMRKTVEKVAADEKYHVSFGMKLLAKYCNTPELQARARASTFDALARMRRARAVFVEG